MQPCPTCEIARLKAEVERLRKDREEVVSYLKAVSDCSREHPEGYTIVDFQRIWLDQKIKENKILQSRAEALEKVVGEFVELVSEAGPVTWCGTLWTWMSAAVEWEKKAVIILSKAERILGAKEGGR